MTRSRQPTENEASARPLLPRYVQVTVPVPPDPRVSSCQLHPTTPLRPTVCAYPSNERGERPVEYTTDAVHVAPDIVLAYSVGCAPYGMDDGETDACTLNPLGPLGGGGTERVFLVGALPLNWTESTGCSSIAFGATPLCPCS